MKSASAVSMHYPCFEEVDPSTRRCCPVFRGSSGVPLDPVEPPRLLYPDQVCCGDLLEDGRHNQTFTLEYDDVVPRQASPRPSSILVRLNNRKAVLLHSFWFLVALAGLAAVSLRALHRPGLDFAVFYDAGVRFLTGADLYGGGREYPYRYAPGAAALFAPLSLVSFRAAFATWVALSAALVLASALWLCRRFGLATAVPLAWLCLLQPLTQELAHGQADVAVLALALASFSAEDAGAEFIAGTLVAIATALKVAPAVLLFDWLLRARWRALVGAVMGGLLLALMLIPTYGLSGSVHQHSLWIVSQSTDAGSMIAVLGNQSLWALARTVGAGWGGGMVASLTLLTFIHSARDRQLRRLLVLASIPLVSAYGWPQFFIVVVPLLAHILFAGGWRAWVAGGAAGAISVLSYDIAGAHVEYWAQASRVLGLLLLIVVTVGRICTSEPRLPEPSRRSPRALGLR